MESSSEFDESAKEDTEKDEIAENVTYSGRQISGRDNLAMKLTNTSSEVAGSYRAVTPEEQFQLKVIVDIQSVGGTGHECIWPMTGAGNQG